MCGIAGIFHRDRAARADTSVILEMTERLMHRGPDDGGIAMLGPTALGHRRLSIIDLSPAGHQPMCTPDERFWITFNGEIYNFQALRAALLTEGVCFRSGSDTEVLLHLYVQRGPDLLEHLNGMFAFAIYDRLEHTLFLARDRIGKKPLYIWDDGERLLFASELKSFFADPAFRPDLDPTAFVDVLHTLYIPDPRTIYREVTRLKPGHAMHVRADRTSTFRYWKARLRPRLKEPELTTRDLDQAMESFSELFRDAVQIRMVSDVPLGAFLSGGVDSSAVVSELTRLSSSPVRTTSIGFDVSSQDEAPFAEQVARTLGCQHHTERVDPRAAELIETLLYHFDEPFADASALPTYLLSQVTRKRVTVAISGDGGDEAFGGYDKYLLDDRERRMRAILPRGAWKLLAHAASLPLLERMEPYRRGANLLRTLADSPSAAYFRTQSFTTPEDVFRLLSRQIRAEINGYDAGAYTRTAWLDASHSDPLSILQSVDYATYLPGDILTKVDRMSMAHALEVRCPLLDHRIVEFALSLPPLLRASGSEGKRVLKALLRKRIPAELVDRPKHGFTIPVDEWFRGALLPLVRDAVLDGGLRRSGLIDVLAAERTIERHARGEIRAGMTLWILLTLAVWYDRIRPGQVVRLRRGQPAVRVEPAPRLFPASQRHRPFV